MTPITVKLFECLGLNPVPVLPFIILNINIAGLTTIIGHPPNLLITGNTYIAKQNITFLTFTIHMCLGVLVALIQTNCHLRIQHRDIQNLLAPRKKANDELGIWNTCLDSIENDRNNDKLHELKMIIIHKIQKLQEMEATLTPFTQSGDSEKSFQATLRQLRRMVRLVLISVIKHLHL